MFALLSCSLHTSLVTSLVRQRVIFWKVEAQPRQTKGPTSTGQTSLFSFTHTGVP
jgi:hypothetical protein